MNIDKSRTLEAYCLVEDKVEFLTKHVHDLVLRQGYFEDHKKSIKKAINHIAEKHEDMLISTFIGKLRFKLPKLRLGLPLSEFECERAQLICSGVITQVVIDSGVFPVREDVDKFEDKNGFIKFRKQLFLVLGGSYETDLYRGIHLEPGVCLQTEINENGRKRKLTGEERAYLKDVASVPFQIWEGCSEELLMKGYSLAKDWGKTKDKNGNHLPEDPIVKRKRFEMYADKIVNHVAKWTFYLSAKYDGRGRTYYDAARLDGIRPQGKLWETLMLSAAQKYYLTGPDSDVLKHVIYCTLHGRTSMDKALEKWSDKDHQKARDAYPMDAKTDTEFGEKLLLLRAAEALDDYSAGRPSDFMFGYDLTNSGLIMSGLGFQSKEMMKAGNLAGLKTVADSHTTFGKAFELPLERKVVKKLHTALLHGGTIRTLTKELNAIEGIDVEVSDVQKSVVNAYGNTVYNIATIADWGTKVVGNNQTVLTWTTPDGVRASSRAYLKGVPVEFYVASANHKEHYTHYVIVSDMPLIEDDKGFPIYDRHTTYGETHYPVEVKKRGLYANITHSLDAFVLRRVVREVIASGRPILLKHDDYIITPGSYDTIVKETYNAFAVLFESDPYQRALDEIAERSPYYPEVPQLIKGDAKFPEIKPEQYNYLMP